MLACTVMTAGRQAGRRPAPRCRSGRSRLLARIMAQENHHLFSARSSAEIPRGGCVIQGVAKGCEGKGIPSLSVLEWQLRVSCLGRIYTRRMRRRRMGASIYISRAAWENRDITRDLGFSRQLILNMNSPMTEASFDKGLMAIARSRMRKLQPLGDDPSHFQSLRAQLRRYKCESVWRWLGAFWRVKTKGREGDKEGIGNP